MAIPILMNSRNRESDHREPRWPIVAPVRLGPCFSLRLPAVMGNPHYPAIASAISDCRSWLWRPRSSMSYCASAGAALGYGEPAHDASCCYSMAECFDFCRSW